MEGNATYVWADQQMLFGNSDNFAIEVDEPKAYEGFEGLYVSFGFWVSGKRFGDRDACVRLSGSVADMKYFNDHAEHRVDSAFKDLTPEEIYSKVYSAFYNYDYTTMPMLQPDLRSIFHMDFIGMGAIQDLYGIVLVAPSRETARLIVQDQNKSLIVADAQLTYGEVERVGKEYIHWGERLLAGQS